MTKKKIRFSQKTTDYYFNADFSFLGQLAERSRAVLLTDENIFSRHKKKFKDWNTIVLKPGEANKIQTTVDSVIDQLIRFETDRKSLLVGVGGGVITDITGYAASIYMRGIRFGFVPVSLLAMVDASIGGKNGVDVGVYKNLVGTIRQPDFLLYDSAFLKTLPDAEWTNGFAEIIKHACIKDSLLFRSLEKQSVQIYKKDQVALDALIKKNALIKSRVVMEDEFEQGERKLLNFGHTWGHAIETKHGLPHGHAVSIGMVMACRLSEKRTGFAHTERVVALLEKYGLPVTVGLNRKEVFEILKMDKKRSSGTMSYVLLDAIGKAGIHNIPLDELEELILSV